MQAVLDNKLIMLLKVSVVLFKNTHTCILVLIVEPDEIKRLSRSFKKLDLNQNGSLSVDEFMSIPELQQNPLVRRVIDILDTDRNGEVDFQGRPRISYQRCWNVEVLCPIEMFRCYYSGSISLIQNHSVHLT